MDSLKYLLLAPWLVLSNPASHPYIPFRTSPFDHSHLHHTISWDDAVIGSNQISPYEADSAIPDPQCPLKFSLGVSRRQHHAGKLSIIEPPVIYPALPALGPGRQVIFTTQYEHLDLMTPTLTTKDSFIKERLVQHVEYPLLFESSVFLTSPVLRDVNADGIVDIILADYDGGIYAIGLQPSPSTGKRFLHKAQVPRLHVRREWLEARVNETLGVVNEEAGGTDETGEKDPVSMGDDIPMNRYENNEKPHDPYHSYFEYTYGSSHEHENILRGVPANVMGQGHEDAVILEERRKRKIQHHTEVTDSEPGSHFEDELPGEEMENVERRRLLEDNPDPEETQPEDDGLPYAGDDIYMGNHGDDVLTDNSEDGEISEDLVGDPLEAKTDDAPPAYGDDDYPRYDDAYPGYGDDYYGRYGNSEHDEYYDDKHYVRIPPHILCTPVAADLPKLYSQNGETETLIFVAVSYYFDEDEYEGFFSYKRFRDRDQGDESEVQRGMYAANAIMVYQYGDAPRWGRQEHLDMSADHSAPINTTLVGSIPLQQDNSKMGAFALASPTVADIDGDGSLDVLIGTSMGILYVMDARNLYVRDGWPVQLQAGIESRVLVEDVRGDTNLEIFVSDVGGTITCLNHKGEKLWHRNLVDGISRMSGNGSGELLAASPMVLGDVDGNGTLDLVQLLHVKQVGGVGLLYLFVLSAESGEDVAYFPKRIVNTGINLESNGEEFVVQKLAAPLLVDLHADQDWLQSYIQRGGPAFTPPVSSQRKDDAPPHGGSRNGIHIVFPVESNIVVMEGGSGCAQTISVGDEVLAMVQADDVHGTGGLDLVVTTSTGNVITLESAAPYHPLNVWNNGEVRGRTNAFAHGYSASQGIFVHGVSREYRDIFGVYIPITFEIFDNRPNIKNEPDRRVYNFEVHIGTSRPIFRKTFNKVGVFTERMYIPDGPGYYSLTAVLKTTHGIVYEDTFHLGYNVGYMEGFGFMLWLPLLVSSVCILLCGTTKKHWDDEDYHYDGDEKNGRHGILGSPLPE